jgi:hypothetical protein
MADPINSALHAFSESLLLVALYCLARKREGISRQKLKWGYPQLQF